MNFANRSRIDKVIAMVRVAAFFGLTVYYANDSVRYFMSTQLVSASCPVTAAATGGESI